MRGVGAAHSGSHALPPSPSMLSQWTGVAGCRRRRRQRAAWSIPLWLPTSARVKGERTSVVRVGSRHCQSLHPRQDAAGGCVDRGTPESVPEVGEEGGEEGGMEGGIGKEGLVSAPAGRRSRLGSSSGVGLPQRAHAIG